MIVQSITLPDWGWWVFLGAFVLGEIVWQWYRTQAVLEDHDRAVNDADYGARGVDQLTEHLAALRNEVTAAMLHHAERLDSLDGRLTPPAPAAPATDEAAAVLVSHWAAGIRTTEPTRTETAP